MVTVQGPYIPKHVFFIDLLQKPCCILRKCTHMCPWPHTRWKCHWICSKIIFFSIYWNPHPLRRRLITSKGLQIYTGYLLFWGEYQIYFIECVENIRIFTSAQHEWKFRCFQLTRWNIFGIYRNQVNFLFILYFLGDLRLIEEQCLELNSIKDDKGLFVPEYLDQAICYWHLQFKKRRK